MQSVRVRSRQLTPSPSAWRLVGLLVIITAAVVAARYYHAFANRGLRSQPQLILNDGSEPLTSFMDSLPRGEPRLLSLAPARVGTRDETASLLRLYHWLHLYGQEGRLLYFLAEKSSEPWAVDEVARHLRDVLLPAIRNKLRNGQYESARFMAQRLVNVMHALPPSEYFELFNDNLNFARKIVHLTTGRYLYLDERAVRSIVAVFEGGRTPIAPEQVHEAEPWLRNYAAYVNAAIVAAQRKHLEARRVWEQFVVEQQPDGPQRAEALFNMINSTMDAYKDLPKKHPERLLRITALTREALTMCEEFVRTFSASYLADDALRYSLRLAFSLGEKEQAFSAYSRLARGYAGTDSFKRIQHGLASWVAHHDKAPFDEARHAAEWLAQYAQRPGAAGGQELIVVDPPSAAARFARILGEGDVQTFLTRRPRESVTRVLMKWLIDHQAEEGVRALWKAPSQS